MSIWWSPNKISSSSPNPTSTSQLNSLADWYQVKFKPAAPGAVKYQILNENGEQEEVFEEVDETTATTRYDWDKSSEQLDVSSNNLNSFIEINIVNCKVKAASCGQCMDPQLISLGCGWCKTNKKCTMKKDCPQVGNFQAWLNDLSESNPSSYCSDPRLTEMLPKCGPLPVHDGSQITLHGENLGRTTKDIRVRMKPVNAKIDFSNELYPADLDCELVDALYVKASRIVCRTRSSGALDSRNATEYSVYVETNVNSLAPVYSSYNQSTPFVFTYVTPTILHMEPRRGIKSGGTLIKLIGKSLSCGNNFSIKLQPLDLNCSLVNITQVRGVEIQRTLTFDVSLDETYNVVYCRTPSIVNQLSHIAPSGGSQRGGNYQFALQIQMDSFREILNENAFSFEYVEDPKIASIKPDRTIASGGLPVIITGRDFDTLQSTHLILTSRPMLANQRAIMYNSDLHSNVYIFKSVSFN
jgi:hypothetical protein